MEFGALPQSAADLATRLKTYLPELKQKYAVRSLGLFGSYVRNEQTPESDVDILVELDEPMMSLIRFIQLENELSDLIGIKVDLVERTALKPTIGKRILSEVTVL